VNDIPANATPYVRETLELLGPSDPVAVLAATPAWLAERAAPLTPAALRRPEAPGKWSFAEVLAHLADAELVNGWRLRLMLTQPRPPIHGYDQVEWQRRFDYAAVDPADALALFAALRRRQLAIWRTVTADDLLRTGLHSERGPESVELHRRLAAGHDLRHRRQIERILAVVR